ncbi:MAG: VWA domain-containing protein [Sphingobacteriales bacterium]|nr:VWA domain-containing protein [Sphingobacteriales bacterium]MBI3720601.1 VWA domain-containing protein [Sphingobacteriales bacterium]
MKGQFEHIEYLIALAVILPLIFLFIKVVKWKKQRVKKIGDEALVKQLIKGYSPKRFFYKFLLPLIAMAIGIVAIANWQTLKGDSQVKRKGVDIMIALDVSKSMLAQDIKPNRLERAKQVVTKLMDKLADDRVGLILFAGHAYLQMPLTTDHAAAKMYLSAATPDAVPTQGTVISEALNTADNAFEAKDKKFKSVIVITDGEDHEEGALDAAKNLVNSGAMVNTIGMGTAEGSPIIEEGSTAYKKDAQGNIIITRLNQAELQQIAAAGKGLYQLYSNTDEVVNNLVAQVDSIGEKEITDKAYLSYQTYFQWLIAVIVLLLLIEIVIPERKLAIV